MPPLRPHLVHIFTSFEGGDAARRSARLIAACGQRYRHTVIALDRRTGLRTLIPQDLDVGVIGPPEPSPLPPVRLWRLRRLLQMLVPDLLLSYGGGTLSVAALNLRQPLAPQIHHEEGRDQRRKVAGAHPLRAELLRRTGAFVTPSSSCAEHARSVWRLEETQVVHIPNGVAGAAIVRRPIEGLERTPGEVVIGASRPLRSNHHLYRLLGAFAAASHHEAAQLVILDEGLGGTTLLRRAARLGLQERLLLLAGTNDPAEQLANFDLFANTEVSGMPLDLLEAMAAGLPVIGPGGDEVRALVSPPNRDFIVAPDNDAALAARLDALLRNGQLRLHLGRSNRARASAFALEPMVDAYRALYDRLLTVGSRSQSSVPR